MIVIRTEGGPYCATRRSSASQSSTSGSKRTRPSPPSAYDETIRSQPAPPSRSSGAHSGCGRLHDHRPTPSSSMSELKGGTIHRAAVSEEQALGVAVESALD